MRRLKPVGCLSIGVEGPWNGHMWIEALQRDSAIVKEGCKANWSNKSVR